MKVARKWLERYITISKYSDTDLANILTSLGLEVEGVEQFSTIKGGLEGLIVGEVLSCEKHENADKLKVTMVNVGSGTPLQIVCGAPNVAAGQKVVVAKEGTTVHPTEGEPFLIKRSKIRGTESQGMLCAKDEIGLGVDHSGIFVLPEDSKIGQPLTELFEVSSDTVFEIGLTPNRSDATCHLGVARDINAYIQTHDNYQDGLIEPGTQGFYVNNTGANIKIDVNHTDCIRYTGVCITDVKIGPSPNWLVNSLKSIGVKSINNVVDITNFILHEYGQPLHAFDLDKITDSKIIVTKLPEGTPFLALDDRTIKLRAEDLMICDGQLAPMCIAGVYGGKNSGISEGTTRIFLESAHFAAGCIRNTSMGHNLRTDAAKVFEKGSDPEVTVQALKKAAVMLCEYAGAAVSSEIIDVYPKRVEPKEVLVKYDKIRALIGVNLPEEKIHDILGALGMGIRKLDQDNLKVSVPTNKVDVIRDVDIIEEILRIYGFNNVPVPDKVKTTISYRQKPNLPSLRNKFGDLLASNGYYEMMGLSLIESKLCIDALGLSNEELVLINNTSNITLDAMRPDMMISGLKSLAHNFNRQQQNIRLFEIGRTYTSTENGVVEKNMLSCFLSGANHAEHWQSKPKAFDVYDITYMINKVLASSGVTKYQVKYEADKRFAYGTTYHVNGNLVAVFGKVHHKVAKVIDIKADVYYGEIYLDEILPKTATSATMKPIGKYPAVTRDLALVVDKAVTFDQLNTIGKAATQPLLKELSMFDLYENEKQLGTGKKSVALRFVFEDINKTLTDQDIDERMAGLIKQYTSQVSAVVRQ